ncbi:DEAD/DEAH box helicase [Candidatus Poribacteria bacterium]|nr:DEAD/DEAH box helicase [Candidatus Poribacteria bacterium]
MLYKGYELDRFQEEAIDSITQGHSVIVAAPTGAGKTVIAEYAVEKCMSCALCSSTPLVVEALMSTRHTKEQNKRIIYTAPIKALSNQKYRDFYKDYGDLIGIMTGDVVLNPFAPVLIMTTEIFRNTIFDDITRLDDVEYVIFDEIHYINDIERGTVWEESIIFAPQNIKFVCLSATMPNLRQFAKWMQSVRDIQIDVVEETERPVPLEHKLYLEGYGVGSLSDLKAVYQFEQQAKIFDLWAEDEWWHEFEDDYKPQKAKELDWEKLTIFKTDLISYISKKRQLPCLYFCFSRKGCEENALLYANKKSFLADRQKKQILNLYDDLCQRYKIYNDPNIEEFRQLIANGVAYHHAGMLPTLKEVVERLFTSGLLQLLFTTETFAVGINMPACSVVFESLEKFDGQNFRYLKTREYHQMAGRAGRRGIDTVGYVYARVSPRFADCDEVERIVAGKLEPIESQFNLSYSSLLNLYAKYGEDIYDVCSMSLSNYQTYEQIRQLEGRIEVLKRELRKLPGLQCVHQDVEAIEEIKGYNQVIQQIELEREALKPKRNDIKRKYRGKKNKKLRAQKLSQLEKQLDKFDALKTQMRCYGCGRIQVCKRQCKEIDNNQQKINTSLQKKEILKNYLREQIYRRLKVLEELGYIDEVPEERQDGKMARWQDGKMAEGLRNSLPPCPLAPLPSSILLPRGSVASQIYGYEMQVTQLLFGGHFEQLDEDSLNVLVMAIVHESKPDEYYQKLKSKTLKKVLAKANEEIEYIRDCEARWNVEQLTPVLDDKLSAAMLAWSQGCDFEELHQYTDISDGDIVRAFRSAIDQLRQMRRALEEHEVLRDKISRCLAKINRDVVDAERQLREVVNG